MVSSAQPKVGRSFPLGGTFGGWLGVGLFPQVKFFKKGAITFGFGPVEVVEQSAATAHHGKKTTAGGEIFDRILKVGGKMVNPFREEGDLDIGRTRVLRMKPISRDDLAFRCGSHEIRRKSYGKKFSSQCRKVGGDFSWVRSVFGLCPRKRMEGGSEPDGVYSPDRAVGER